MSPPLPKETMSLTTLQIFLSNENTPQLTRTCKQLPVSSVCLEPTTLKQESLWTSLETQPDKKKENVSPPDVWISKKHHRTKVSLWQKEASCQCGEIAGAWGEVAVEMGHIEKLKVPKFRRKGRNSEATELVDRICCQVLGQTGWEMHKEGWKLMVWGIGLYFGAHIMKKKKKVAVWRFSDNNLTCCIFPLSGKG